MIKFYCYVTIVFGWIASQFYWVECWARERWEKHAWEYWESHPEEKARVEEIARQVAEDMNLKEKLFGNAL